MLQVLRRRSTRLRIAREQEKESANEATQTTSLGCPGVPVRGRLEMAEARAVKAPVLKAVGVLRRSIDLYTAALE